MSGNMLLDAIKKQTSANPGGVALIEEGRQLTYAGLWKETDELAAFFAGQGIGKGTIVPVYYKNSIQLAVVFLALLSVNASPLILSQERLGTADLDSFHFHALIIAEGEQHFFPAYDNHPVTRHGDLRIIFNTKPAKKISPKLPGILVTSSGSTSKPKLIVLTMEGVLQNIKANSQSLGIVSSDISLQCLPMSYSYGLVGQFLTHLYCGAGIVFSSNKLLVLMMSGYISKYKITTLFTVPPMLRQFLALVHPGNSHEVYASLRLVTIGGNHVEAYTVKKAMTLFNCQVVKTYGLAEAGPRVCSNFITPGNESAINTAGKPIDRVSIDIVDAKGNPLQKGLTGRILVNSPCVSAGYLHQAERSIVTGKRVLTKDYGYIEKNGNLVVVGRRGQYMYAQSRKIWFSEIESVIYNSGQVCKIASSKKGRSLYLQVLPLSNCRITEEGINEMLIHTFGKGIESRVHVEFINILQIKTLK